MTDAARPPVSEVVHSVALARQSALSGPQLPSVIGNWFTDHSRVETAPPYEIPPETAELSPLQPPRLQLLAQQAPRYWLISADDQEIIQIQPDFVALNWRYRDDTSEYRGYPFMRSRFLELLETIKSGLSHHEGAFKPTRAELTYINTIHPSGLWTSHSDTHKLINAAVPVDAPYEQLGFFYSQRLTSPEGGFAGRLHVTLSPATDWVKSEPQLTLNLTARSADFVKQDIEEVSSFMDLAHFAIEKTFFNLISAEARSSWGLE